MDKGISKSNKKKIKSIEFRCPICKTKLKNKMKIKRICYICDMGISSKDIPVLVYMNKKFYFCCQKCKDVFFNTVSASRMLKK